MKQQILLIHGGNTFDSYEEYLDYLKNRQVDLEKILTKRWKTNLQADLGESYEVIFPSMPNDMTAKYEEWKIMFEKFLPFLRDDLIIVGHSLGGIFLAKYLSENNFPHKIKATFLVAPPFDDKTSEYSLGTFILPADLYQFAEQGGKITIYQSHDDPIVPATDADKYKNALPAAEVRMFSDRGHFDQMHLPELVEQIQSLN